MSKKDTFWKHAYTKDGENFPRCKFCDKKSSGGINRLKQHWAGTHRGIEPCTKVPDEVKKDCILTLKTFSSDKEKRNELLREIGEGPGSDSIGNYEKIGSGLSGSKDSCPTQSSGSKPQSRGPMDLFVNVNAKQTTLNSAFKKEQRNKACRKIGRLVFDKMLPFNIVNSPFWKPAIDAIAEYGPGFKPPSMHELRTWILKAEVDDINCMKKEHMKVWKEYGCSIMSDGWTDGKGRVLVNFLVNSPFGTFFLKSIDASDIIKNGELMFKYIDEVVKEVGEENVIQVITDSASNMKNAGKRLMEKRSRLWWTPCAAHCIDLMLEDIGKMKVFSETLEKAKNAVKFIYGHSIILAMMRKYTGDRELLRPTITRFCTAFLTLQSIYKQKRPLSAMFTSQEWSQTNYARSTKGMATSHTLLYDPDFWPHVAFCIKAAVPIVCVLREVDSEERPAMGFIYELMDRAKEKIKLNFNGADRKYKPIWKKIDNRWTPQLHQPLHAVGYYLNPQLRFEDSFSDCDEMRKGLYACMDRMMTERDRIIADVQLELYDKQKGDFGSAVATKTRHLRSPASWWERFGKEVPELMKFAIRVLNLTCSASGCERNWSTFESIHTKKRNRLEHKRLNALVYVKYNTGLRERSIRRRAKMDPILVDDIDSDDEWIAEKEEAIFPTNITWMDDEDIFSVAAIKNVPILSNEEGAEIQTPKDHLGSSSAHKRKDIGEGSSKDVDKGKRPKLAVLMKMKRLRTRHSLIVDTSPHT